MAVRKLPETFKQLLGTKITSKFSESAQVREVPMALPGPHQLLIKNRFVGVNATDVNRAGGRYDRNQKVPFLLGLEGLGSVVAMGDGCPSLLNKSVLYTNDGAFSEYTLVDYRKVIPVPKLDRNYISLPISGTTAAISLDKTGQLKDGETVLVTAAAGGTGQFAVQWAKNKGCHVIGTCSTEEKAEFIKSLGCDRAVNYTKEDLNDVLKAEYPKGVDVVYECVGGKMFEAALKNLAVRGRLVIIGLIQNYLSESRQLKADDVSLSSFELLPAILLARSASVSGFLLFNETENFTIYISKLVELYNNGKLRVTIDQGETTEGGPFVGVERIFDAVDFLYSKKSKGKVVVELNPE